MTTGQASVQIQPPSLRLSQPSECVTSQTAEAWKHGSHSLVDLTAFMRQLLQRIDERP